MTEKTNMFLGITFFQDVDEVKDYTNQGNSNGVVDGCWDDDDKVLKICIKYDDVDDNNFQRPK